MSEDILFCGFRQDGRKIAELRDIQIQVGIVNTANGSALFQIGNTKVLASVYGPKQTRFEKERGKVFCYFTSAHFSTTGERKKVVRGDKKSNEFEDLVKDMIESVVLFENIPHSDLDIHISVLQDDGSLESASINAINLALIDAGVPMKDYLVSCSCGFFNGKAILDVTYAECLSFSVISEFRVAVLGSSGLISYLNYEQFGSSKLSVQVMKELLALAVEGCKQIHFFIRQFCLNHYSY
jgi:exosome complex component RRP41